MPTNTPTAVTHTVPCFRLCSRSGTTCALQRRHRLPQESKPSIHPLQALHVRIPSLCALRQSPIFTRQNIVENIATGWPHLIAVSLCVEIKTSVNEACVPCRAPASVTHKETLPLRCYTKRQNEMKVDLRTQSKSFPPFGHLFQSCLKLESRDCPGNPECCLWGSESFLCPQR